MQWTTHLQSGSERKMITEVWVAIGDFDEYEQAHQDILSVHLSEATAYSFAFYYAQAYYPKDQIDTIPYADGVLDVDEARGISAVDDKDLHGGLHSITITRHGVQP